MIIKKKPDSPLIIVTPVYEDHDCLKNLIADLSQYSFIETTLVIVDDGSLKDPCVSIDLLCDHGINAYVLKLTKNVGHQRAISVGLAFVVQNIQTPGVIVLMDSDGEDSPASVQLLAKALEDPNVDIAVAQRGDRLESFRFKAFYKLYKIIFYASTGKKISFGNFMAMKPFAAKRLSAMAETQIHIAAAVLSSRLRVKEIITNRALRYTGESKMNFVGLVLHGFRGMMVFAEDVLVRVGIACTVTALFSVASILVAIVLKAAGVATPGWFSVALGLLILIFMQTGTLALMTLLMTGNLKINQRNSIDENLKLIGETKYFE
jgi:hypothetical protein